MAGEDKTQEVDEDIDLTAPLGDEPGDVTEGAAPSEVEAPEPVEATEPTVSFRDILTKQGVDLSGYEDDNAAIAHFAKQIQESQQVRQQADSLSEMAKYGQTYLENAGQFQRWQEEQAKQQAQPETDPFAPPEMNPAWYNQVERNDQGGLTPINGGTPEIAAKVQKFLQWKAEFDANPYKHMESFVDRRAEERAKSLVAEEMSRMREQMTAEMFVTNNRSWLFEEGKYDSNGAPKLTERGDAFRGFLAEGTNLGLTGKAAQDLAMSRLQQWDQLQQYKAAPPAPAVDQKEKFLTEAAGHTPSPAASTNPPSTGDQPPQNENQTLDEMIRAEMKAAKITDADISALSV